MATVFKTLPGVRIEEVRLGAPPIIGVGTSTAGFVGMAPKTGTADKTQFKDELRLVTSADQFIADYISDPDLKNDPPTTTPVNAKRSTALSYAVLGFFKNGGTECYVLNVDSEDSTIIEKGIDRLAEKPDIDIIAAPVDEAKLTDKKIWGALSNQAKGLANRFAILDPPKKTAAGDLISGGAKRPVESIWSAFYYPRIQVSGLLKDDPATEFICPSGHIAGLYAQVDGSRGVHKAPANVALAGVLGVEDVVGDSDQNTLNKDGVDVIRLFPDGPVVWGARTLQGNGSSIDSTFAYISSRRFATFVEQSLRLGLRFAVFEPNNLALRQIITRSVRGFLDGVWRDGALFGATADEAYYVRFPDPFNTDTERQKGNLTLEIGLRVAPPAEFIIIRIGLLDRPANAA